MAKIIGNTTATPNPRPDWNQSDETKADFIKNKPDLSKLATQEDLLDTRDYVNKNFLSTALQGTAEGAVVRIDDISAMDIVNVKVTKANLVNFEYQEQMLDGITFITEGDMITLNGTSVGLVSLSSASFALPIGQYVFSIDNLLPDNCSIKVYDNTNEISSSSLSRGSCIFDVAAESSEIVLQISIGEGTTFDEFTIKACIEKSAVKIYRYGKNLFENDTTKLALITTNATGTQKVGYELHLPVGSYTAHAEGDAGENGFIYGRVVNTETREVVDDGLNLLVGTDLRNQKFTINEGEMFLLYNGKSSTAVADAEVLFSRFNIQIEAGNKKTAFEPCVVSAEYTVNEDGVEVVGMHPTTTLVVDAEGATINCTYNRDINKAFEEIRQAILSLGGNF